MSDSATEMSVCQGGRELNKKGKENPYLNTLETILFFKNYFVVVQVCFMLIQMKPLVFTKPHSQASCKRVLVYGGELVGNAAANLGIQASNWDD